MGTLSKKEMAALAEGRSSRIQEHETSSRVSLPCKDVTIHKGDSIYLDTPAKVSLAMGRNMSMTTSLSEMTRRQVEPNASASSWMCLNRLAPGPLLLGLR